MLEIKNLKKTFTDGTRAINDVSFKLNRGEFVVVLGPSGSGKTTLLRCINSLLVKTAGQIILCNQEIETSKQKFVQKHISMIFQDFKLVSNLSVLNNVLSGMLEECHSFASLFYLFNKKQKLRALECIDQVGLLSKAYVRINNLSGGQKQRVGIARAIVRKPLIILADEPVASLDPLIAFQILSLLKEICYTHGITVICNLHQLELALHFSDRIIGLKDGSIVLDTATKNISYKHIYKIYEEDNQGIFFGTQDKDKKFLKNTPFIF